MATGEYDVTGAPDPDSELACELLSDYVTGVTCCNFDFMFIIIYDVIVYNFGL